MGYFLLFNVARDIRGDVTAHRSMMIHVSRFTNVQNQIADIANEWLVQVKSDILNYAALSDNESNKIATISYLHQLWDNYSFEQLTQKSWSQARSQYLHKAIAPICVRGVNQKSGATSLDYFAHKEDGLRVIAVGGNSLSRGLTLEGLGVSYFYRRSQMYDTLLQMGRWFGYRPNYEDLFKIWISEDAVDWYGYITNAANELKDEIAKMKMANQRPLNFGLKVRQDPNSLIATARNKMRSAQIVCRPVAVTGRLLETPRLKASPAILRRNEMEFRAFVDKLASVGLLDNTQKKYYWRDVPKEMISHLLLNFETHPWQLSFQGKALAEYIDTVMKDEKWDVALLFDGEGDAPQAFKYGEGELALPSTAKRKIVADEKMIRISGTKAKVSSGGAARIGLSSEQVELAQVRFKAVSPDKKNLPDSAYLIKERAPLLMMHVIQVDLQEKESTNSNVPKFIYALGVGFPATGDGVKTANYVVNMVELANWMDPKEDDDE